MKTIRLKLSIFERISIPTILPQRAKYEVGVVCRDLAKRFTLDQAEIVRLNFRSAENPDGSVRMNWDVKKDKGKEFDITELELEIIKSNLERMNKEEQLPTSEGWLALYERFKKTEISKKT